MFENPKNWEELKSNVSEILKKNKAGKDIERGEFEPEPAKNPQKKPLSQRMQEEGEFKDEQEKSDFDFIFGID